MTSAKLRQQRLRRRDSVAEIMLILMEFGFRVHNNNLELNPPGERPLQKFLLATARVDEDDVVTIAHRDAPDIDLNPGWELIAVWDLDTRKGIGYENR